MSGSPTVVGLLLAAGSGSRLGRPKALVTDADGTTWLVRSLHVLADGGCPTRYVVLGAAADQVRPAVPAGVAIVVADDWAEGMGASLRAGLTAVAAREPDTAAVLVMLVDTPGVTADVVARLLAAGEEAETTNPDVTLTSALARASYEGAIGHPVLIGRSHWAGVVASARGDRGARDYLAANDVEVVECGDLGTGDDIDTEPALVRWRRA